MSIKPFVAVATLILAVASSFAASSFAASKLSASKKSLNIEVYNPGEKGIFPVSSEIISGPREVVLVDAQFAVSDAKALVDKIKASGKTLKTIYISHSDPDYYFGLETLTSAFPNAKVVATAQTVEAIKSSKDGKLAYWGPILKDNAPKSVIVPEALTGDTLTVDGQELKIVGLDGPTPDRTFVWIPSKKAVVGGIVLFANKHAWIADTQTPKSRAEWISTLDKISALKPALVVPGHYALNKDGSKPFTKESIDFTREYVKAFEIEAAKASDSRVLIAAMQARYPTLAGATTLELSAKVIKGEMKWPAEDPKPQFLAAGKKARVTFGDVVFELDFKNDHTMTFIGTAGAFKGTGDTVEYTAVKIRPQVFMLYWREPSTGANIVHLEDFEKGIVHTNIIQADGKALHMSGKLELLN